VLGLLCPVWRGRAQLLSMVHSSSLLQG
jgi:hypothetical protein